MDDNREFQEDVERNIARQGNDSELREMSINWMKETGKYNYSYMFRWLGRPIIQFPQDIIAMQELIWDVKPDLIIETGVARGGSVIFYSSMLELLAGGGKVIGIDIDIREHNRREIESHPMYKNIILVEGPSTSDNVVQEVDEYVKLNGCKTILVALDSNHTHDHVLQELRSYSKYVTKGSYLVVFDTTIDNMPKGHFEDKPWDKGGNPKSAVKEFLEENDRFEIDTNLNSKLLISANLDGWLKCVK